MQANFKQQGFTLVELMVTIVIMGLFAAMAMPAMSRMAQGATQNEAAAGFVSVINSARQEALRQGVAVYLCGANIRVNGNLQGCKNQGNVSERYRDGIVSFADRDRNTNYSADESLRTYQIKNTIVLRAQSLNAAGELENINAAEDKFGFQGNGNVIGQQLARRFVFTDANDPLASSKIVYVDYSGRSAVCTTADREPGRGYIQTLCTPPDAIEEDA